MITGGLLYQDNEKIVTMKEKTVKNHKSYANFRRTYEHRKTKAD